MFTAFLLLVAMRLGFGFRAHLEVHGTYQPFIVVLITVPIALIKIEGHLVGYKYSDNWLISTMNLQVGHGAVQSRRQVCTSHGDKEVDAAIVSNLMHVLQSARTTILCNSHTTWLKVHG